MTNVILQKIGSNAALVGGHLVADGFALTQTNAGVVPQHFTVATLPAAASASYSGTVWVTDSTTSYSSATLGTTPIGSGSYSVPVSSNGAIWFIH